jgi:cytochrome c553
MRWFAFGWSTPLAVTLACLAAHLTTPSSAAEGIDGAALYRKACARCHGNEGQGTAKHRPMLAGELAIPQLARQIRDTMPEDNPGSLSEEQARAIAGFIHPTFYSKEARERHAPPTIELARLTVRQYRQVLADLVAGVRHDVPPGEPPGLRGEYYKNRRFRRDDRVLTRTDAGVDFDFGTASPVPDKIEPHEFSIVWTGSILVPDTGEYEFIVHTEHATRLMINARNRPIIDAWVKSGTDTEYRAAIFLVGGRRYPLRLEYSKAKQGVDDSKTNKEKPPPVKSSIRLLWKPPHRAVEAVPARLLSPREVPESYVVTQAFPPDDRSYGWERGTTISKAWDQAATHAALDAARYIADRIDTLAGTKEDDPERLNKIKDYARGFAERAFRRPLTPEQKQVYLERPFAVTADVSSAIKRLVLLVLKSPRFLYREVEGAGDDFDVAARLSFALWDSIPDQELWRAAAAQQLRTREQVVRHAERMLNDQRARSKVRSFFLHWLKIDPTSDLAKDSQRFAGFDGNVIADLNTSLELFLDDIMWGPQPDLRRLLLDDELYLNGRLAKFYGVDLPESAPFQRVKLNAGHRAGVLTHPFLMATFAYTGESSPIHRGVFLARGILGLSLKPPPEAVAPIPPTLHPGLTTRERVTLQTKPVNCMSCHEIINPLGFALETYDAVGRYRERENAKPIDTSGTYLTRSGRKVTFSGVRDLAQFLAQSDEVHAAVVEQLFHHLAQQSMRAYGADVQRELTVRFAGQECNMRKLVVEIAAVAAQPSAAGPLKSHRQAPPETPRQSDQVRRLLEW